MELGRKGEVERSRGGNMEVEWRDGGMEGADLEKDSAQMQFVEHFLILGKFGG